MKRRKTARMAFQYSRRGLKPARGFWYRSAPNPGGRWEEEGQQVEEKEGLREVLPAMTEVVFQVVALVLQGVERLILDLPPRPSAPDHFLDILLGHLDVRDPRA